MVTARRTKEPPRRKHELIAMGVLCLWLVGVIGATAIAHPRENASLQYFNTDPEVGRCSVTVGRIADGNSAQGFTRSIISYHKLFTPRRECLQEGVSRPTGHLAARYDWFAYKNGKWSMCHSTDWRTNPRPVSSWSVYTDWSVRKCGSAIYLTRGWGSVVVQGSWSTASADSPTHRF